MVVNGCQGKWKKHGNRCYLWSDEGIKKSWADAEEYCKGEGGNLASVTSKAINDYIKREGITKKRFSRVWLGGLADQEKEGVWKWSDESPWEFQNWNHGEPGDHTGQHCLAQIDYWSLRIDYGRIDKWNAYDCNDKNNFVCSQTLQSGKTINPLGIDHYFTCNRFSTTWMQQRQQTLPR